MIIALTDGTRVRHTLAAFVEKNKKSSENAANHDDELKRNQQAGGSPSKMCFNFFRLLSPTSFVRKIGRIGFCTFHK
jgi:hypothetical protein